MVVKAKALDVDIANVVNDVAQVCGGDLAPVYEKFKMKDEFRFVIRSYIKSHFIRDTLIVFTILHALGSK